MKVQVRGPIRFRYGPWQIARGDQFRMDGAGLENKGKAPQGRLGMVQTRGTRMEALLFATAVLTVIKLLLEIAHHLGERRKV